MVDAVLVTVVEGEFSEVALRLVAVVLVVIAAAGGVFSSP